MSAFTPISQTAGEDPRFLTRQLITYLGNKRSLLPDIEATVLKAGNVLGKTRLVTADLFTGSGVVARLLKRHSRVVIANDLETYAAIIGRCYLTNRDDIDLAALALTVARLNAEVDGGLSVGGFVEELYAPHDDGAIRPGERVFYTRDNARRLDAYRALIGAADEWMQPYLLGPLLARASVHANTAGVFKGFHKDRDTGIGQFGGTGKEALARIQCRIELDVPVLSHFSCASRVIQGDVNETARTLGPLDFAYLDPPYNQHPYGSNYFMLNLLASNLRPGKISDVSGIPQDWNRSGYNRRREARALMEDLVATLDARFIAVSFNNEGFISLEEMTALLERFGAVERTDISYSAYSGSQNLTSRGQTVIEHLFLLEKRRRGSGPGKPATPRQVPTAAPVLVGEAVPA